MADLLSLTLRAPDVRDGVDVPREQFPERPGPLILAPDSGPDVVCLFADGYIDGVASRQPHARREQCDEYGATGRVITESWLKWPSPDYRYRSLTPAPDSMLVHFCEDFHH